MNNRRCRHCRYYGHRTRTCDYYLLTGTRRPCPAALSCTAFERGDRRQEAMRLEIRRAMQYDYLKRGLQNKAVDKGSIKGV